MPRFRLEGSIIVIEPDPIIADSLTRHMQSVRPVTKMSFYPISLSYQEQCSRFCQQISGAAQPTTIRFAYWSEFSLAMYEGVIGRTFQTITTLDLSASRVRDADIPYIVALLRQHPEMTHIQLNNNFITSRGAKTLLTVLLEMPALELVDLSGNDIGYYTCKFITSLVELFTDIQLAITDNQGDDEIASFKTVSPEERALARTYLGDLASEFHPGDLLYGLHAGLPADKGRNPVEAALKKALIKQAKHQLIIVNPFSDWVVNKNRFERASRIDLLLFEEFISTVTPSIYPQDRAQPFVGGWSEHKVLCKLGILWAKKNGTKIHYVLDDLRMEQFSSGSRDHADTSVTESEIKFIARFYEHLRDCVEFWRTDEHTGRLIKARPPWLDPSTKQHWDAYMQAQRSKMRFFPKGPMSNQAFFEAMYKRKDYSLLAYKAAVEALLQDVLDKTDEPMITSLITKYLAALVTVKSKYQLQENVIFALAEEYAGLAEEVQDSNLELLLKNLIKPAKTYSSASEEDRFFYRRSIQSRLYGNKVLDMKALFRLADALDAAAADESLSSGSHLGE